MVKCKRFMVLIAYAQESLFDAHADVPSGAIGLIFGLNLHLHTYFVYVSSKGSVESAYDILTSEDSDEPLQPPLSLKPPNGVQSVA